VPIWALLTARYRSRFVNAVAITLGTIPGLGLKPQEEALPETLIFSRRLRASPAAVSEGSQRSRLRHHSGGGGDSPRIHPEILQFALVQHRVRTGQRLARGGVRHYSPEAGSRLGCTAKAVDGRLGSRLVPIRVPATNNRDTPIAPQRTILE
jgi:hypothetical protein